MRGVSERESGAPVVDADDGLSQADGTGTITWWVMLAIGLAITSYGVRGLVDGLAPERLVRWAGWFLGGLLVHDLVAVPLYSTLGLGVRRVVPRTWRAPVQVGAILSAVIALVSWPVLRGYGRSAQEGNATVLPYDYGQGLLLVLGVVWTAVVVAGVLATRVAASRSEGPAAAVAGAGHLPVVDEDLDALAHLDFEVDPDVVSVPASDHLDIEVDDRELVLMSTDAAPEGQEVVEPDGAGEDAEAAGAKGDVEADPGAAADVTGVDPDDPGDDGAP